MKLKYLLVIAFVLVSAVPLLQSLLYLNDFTATQYRAQMEDKLSSLSLLTKKRIQAVVARVREETSLIASRTQMRLSLKSWFESGDQEHVDRLRRILTDAEAGMSGLHGIDLYDVNGRLVVSTRSDIEASTSLDRKKLRSNIEFTAEQGKLLLNNTQALFMDNSLIGYVTVRFVANFLTDMVEDRSGLGRSGEWLFAVRNSKGEAVLALPLPQEAEKILSERLAMDTPEYPIVQAMMRNEIIVRDAPDYSGKRVLASTRYIPEMDWGLVLKIDESEVNEIADRTEKLIYVMGLAVFALAIALGLVISIYIARPIELLTRHTDAVAKGSFDEHDSTGRWLEIINLSDNFNQMVRSLRDLTENLNEKVEERTRQLEKSNEKLKELSIRDPLTGLHNRRYLTQQLDKEIRRARRYNGHFTFAMLDIDDFKKINDSYGHDTGDVVLIRVGQTLISVIRDSDIVARFGGEEFCFLMPSNQDSVNIEFFDRIREELASLIFRKDDVQFKITCSFGIAEYDGKCSATQLMKMADIALYEAKSTGKNRVVLFSGPPINLR